MSPEDVRLEALKLAVAHGVPELRFAFYDFLNGETDREPRTPLGKDGEASNAI